AGAEELRLMVLSIAQQRDEIEWRIYFGSLTMLMPDRLSSQEAAGGQGDALVTNRDWTLVDRFLRFLHGERVVLGIQLDVGHVALQSTHGLIVGRSGGRDRLRAALRGLRELLSLLRLLLRLTDCAVPGCQVLPQLLNLPLLGVESSLHLLQLGGDVAGCGRAAGRRRSPAASGRALTSTGCAGGSLSLRRSSAERGR